MAWHGTIWHGMAWHALRHLQQIVHRSITFIGATSYVILWNSYYKKKVSKKFSFPSNCLLRSTADALTLYERSSMQFSASPPPTQTLPPHALGVRHEFRWMARFSGLAFNNCRCCRWIFLHRCNHLRFSAKHFRDTYILALLLPSFVVIMCRQHVHVSNRRVIIVRLL